MANIFTLISAVCKVKVTYDKKYYIIIYDPLYNKPMTAIGLLYKTAIFVGPILGDCGIFKDRLCIFDRYMARLFAVL